MKFRKKPVVIEAMQFNPEDEESLYALVDWMTSNGQTATIQVDRNGKFGDMDIQTLEDGDDARAKHVASPGDWIIRGVHGEFYPVKDSIFRETYEPAEETG